MKKQMLAVITCLAAGIMISSCDKSDKQQDPQPNPVSDEVLAQIKAHGFSTDNVRKTKDGYLVEGDILLTEGLLKENVSGPTLRVGKVEQYRTSHLVTGLPRAISVKVVGLPAAYLAGVDTALMHYNRLNLRITFQRIVSGSAAITVQGYNEPAVNGYVTYGSSGFPTSAGDPYSAIILNYNAAAYGSSPNVLYIASEIRHHIGHCIGMYHTDYMDRSYSCGKRGPGVEGGSPVWIPGTPTGPDPDSWMLACSNGITRNFNANDIIALNYLYH